MQTTLDDSEAGIALVYALLATIIITGIVTVLVALAVTELRDTGRAARFENAIHVAEGGADVVVTEVAAAPSTVTAGPSGDHVYDLGTSATNDAIETWALDIATTNCNVIATGDGEACGIRPLRSSTGTPMDVVFGVGFVPSRANPMQTRVVRIEYDRGFFSSTKAVLSQGNLTLDGSSAIFGLAGSVHTNSDILAKGSASVEDDLTYSGSNLGDTPSATAVFAPTETVPETRAEDIYAEQSGTNAADWYDLCPDGTAKSPSVSGPCTGTQLWSIADTAEFRGWSYSSTGPATATWSASGETLADGIYYIHHGNVTVSGQGKSKSANPATLTILLGAVEPDCTPSAVDNGSLSGHFKQTGNLTWAPFLGDSLVVADGDMDIRGNPNTADNQSDVEGVYMARQQFDASGNLTVSGSFISQDVCNDPDSPVQANSISGSVDIQHDGALLVPVSGQVRVIAWNEL